MSKERFKRYKVRKEQLPASCHEAIDAVERYALRFGGPTTGETVVRMLEDLVEIFEQARGTAPRSARSSATTAVQFTEDVLKSYPAGPWAAKEQQRLAPHIGCADATAHHEALPAPLISPRLPRGGEPSLRSLRPHRRIAGPT